MDFREIEFKEKYIFLGLVLSFIGVMAGFVFANYVLAPQIDYVSNEYYVLHRMTMEEFQPYQQIVLILTIFSFLSIFAIPPFMTSYMARYSHAYSSVVSSLIIGVFFSMLYIIANGTVPQLALFRITAVMSLLHVPGGIAGHYVARKARTAPVKN